MWERADRILARHNLTFDQVEQLAKRFKAQPVVAVSTSKPQSLVGIPPVVVDGLDTTRQKQPFVPIKWTEADKAYFRSIGIHEKYYEG